MDGLLLGDDEAGAASGPLRQVVGLPLAGQVVLGEVGQVGGERDAVRHGYSANLQRRKQELELSVHRLFSHEHYTTLRRFL
jgi:hypothetical protein